MQGVAEHGVKEALNKYQFNNSSNHYTRLIDDLQWNVKCCGATNASDWIEAKGRIPESCCPKEFNTSCALAGVATTTTQSPFSSFNRQPIGVVDSNSRNVELMNLANANRESFEQSHVYQQGCVQAVVGAFSNSLGPVGGACLAVALFQLLGVVFAFCLGRAVKREYQVV